MDIKRVGLRGLLLAVYIGLRFLNIFFCTVPTFLFLNFILCNVDSLHSILLLFTYYFSDRPASFGQYTACVWLAGGLNPVTYDDVAASSFF